MEQRYDTLSVSIETGKVEAIFEKDNTKSECEAVSTMAVYRRGVEDNFYPVVPTGKYKIGDAYKGCED